MPVPPGSKGQREFLYNITDDMRAQHRLQVLDCTRQQLMEVTHKSVFIFFVFFFFLFQNWVKGKSWVKLSCK